jgi:hypothetical protein
MKADHSSKDSYQLLLDQETERRSGSTRAAETIKTKKKTGIFIIPLLRNGLFWNCVKEIWNWNYCSVIRNKVEETTEEILKRDFK